MIGPMRFLIDDCHQEEHWTDHCAWLFWGRDGGHGTITFGIVVEEIFSIRVNVNTDHGSPLFADVKRLWTVCGRGTVMVRVEVLMN